MIRRPPRSTQSRSSAASDVYKRQGLGPWGRAGRELRGPGGCGTPPARSRGGPTSARPRPAPSGYRGPRARPRCPGRKLTATSRSAYIRRSSGGGDQHPLGQALADRVLATGDADQQRPAEGLAPGDLERRPGADLTLVQETKHLRVAVGYPGEDPPLPLL